MGKYDEKISDNSIWVTATPTPLAMTMPFYITEAGRFVAQREYKVQRDSHSSFLLLYTLDGNGAVKAGDTAVSLTCGCAVIIDCHAPHEYFSQTDKWEFMWTHFNGIAADALFNAVYPNGCVRAVNMEREPRFEHNLSRLISKTTKNDVAGCIDISSGVHSLLNSVCLAALENENVSVEKKPADDIQAVITFIENNYSDAVTVDDMTRDIHVSKYHFIRRFRRAMGITPYSYLTNYRINVSKTLLRSTDKTVCEIAEQCGFLDTSNFITQFKKHTGQKPLQYRRDFS